MSFAQMAKISSSRFAKQGSSHSDLLDQPPTHFLSSWTLPSLLGFHESIDGFPGFFGVCMSPCSTISRSPTLFPLGERSLEIDYRKKNRVPFF